MSKPWMKLSLLSVLLLTTSALAAGTAEVKVGTGVEKTQLVGATNTFKVAPDTRLYAGALVTGVENGAVTVVWFKDDKEVSRTELKVPRSPWRTHAYRTFRAGESGSWTAKVLDASGAELGSTPFTVEVSG
jgi:hypothetical protein